MAKIEVKLVKSGIGCSKNQKRVLKSLGLTKLNKVRTYSDNPAVRGMLYKVSHLIEEKQN